MIVLVAADLLIVFTFLAGLRSMYRSKTISKGGSYWFFALAMAAQVALTLVELSK